MELFETIEWVLIKYNIVYYQKGMYYLNSLCIESVYKNFYLYMHFYTIVINMFQKVISILDYLKEINDL